MNRLALLAALISIPATAVSAHPREDISRTVQPYQISKPVKLATADADVEPRVRIRDDRTGQGLSPRDFARWINRHPALVEPKRAESSLRVLASTALPAHVVTSNFALADRNQDGRISADELADFVMHLSDPAHSRYDS